MFRVIEAARPTLFCDEMSSIGDKERALEIRGVVNSSHCRADAQVIRNVPVADGYEPRAFSTWAPMALAYIKHVDDQIRDRSIIIPMQRKAPGQTVAQLRLDQDQGFGELARKAARWASDHLEALRRADPDVPRELNDRAADNWRPLLSIADRVGGDWHERARAAAIALSLDADDEDTIGVDLLRDLWAVFDALGANRLLSSTIVAKLVEMEGRPWAEFGRAGKPITTHQLARLLKPFKVFPGSVRPDVPGDGTKGLQARILHRSLGEVLSNWHIGTTHGNRHFPRFSNRHTEIRCANLKSAETQGTRHLCRCANWIACDHCGEPVEPGAPGTTAISDGRHLHTACVGAWTKP